MNTILDEKQADFAHAMLAPSRTCVAEGKVYVHHYTECSTSYGVTTESMQAIENYDHGTIKAVNGYAFRKHLCAYHVYNIERIYLLSQRCRRYSVYYDTYAIQLVIFDKMYNVYHYPRQLINDYGFTVYQSLFPHYVITCVAKQYGMVEMWHIKDKLTT